MDANLWYRLRNLEQQFAAHCAKSAERTSHEIDLGTDVADRVDAIEFNMSGLLLVVQTLGELCGSRNAFSEDAFKSLLRAIDLFVGDAAGLLKPNAVAGMHRLCLSQQIFSRFSGRQRRPQVISPWIPAPTWPSWSRLSSSDAAF